MYFQLCLVSSILVILARGQVHSNISAVTKTYLVKHPNNKTEQGTCLECNGNTVCCLSNETSTFNQTILIECLEKNETSCCPVEMVIHQSHALKPCFRDVLHEDLHGNNVNNSNISTINNGTFHDNRTHNKNKRPIHDILVTLVKVGLFVIGVTGNTLIVMTIINTKSMQNLQNYFVFNLAVTDLFTLIVYLPLNIKESFDPTWPFGEFSCRYLLPIFDIVPPVSVLTMVAISIDRYRAITSTLSRTLTVKSTVLLLVSLWIGCYIVVGLPVSFVMRLTRKFQCVAYFKSTAQSRAYYTLRSVLLYVLPCLSIFFCYVRVNKTLGNSMRFLKRSVTGKSQVIRLKRQRRVMSMFFAIFVTFAVCYLPFNVIILVYNYVKIPQTYFNVFKYSLSVAQIFGIGNSVCNPIILYCLSHAYRTKFQTYLPILKCTRGRSEEAGPTPRRSTTSDALSSDHEQPAHSSNHPRRVSGFSLSAFSPRLSIMKRLHRMKTNNNNKAPLEPDNELLENNNAGTEEIHENEQLIDAV